VYNALKQQIASGWPADQNAVPDELRQYYTFADELVVCQDFVYKGQRLVIPVDARPWILDRLHSGHTGINSCLRRARELVFWPGMTAKLKQLVAKKSDTSDTPSRFIERAVATTRSTVQSLGGSRSGHFHLPLSVLLAYCLLLQQLL